MESESDTLSETPPRDTPTSSRQPTPSPLETRRRRITDHRPTNDPELKKEPPPLDTFPRPQVLQIPFSGQLEEVEKAKRSQSHPEPLPTATQATQDTTPRPQPLQTAFSQQFEEIEKTEHQQATVPQHCRQGLGPELKDLSKDVEVALHKVFHGEPCELQCCRYSRDFNEFWGPGSRKRVGLRFIQILRALWAKQKPLLLDRLSQDRPLTYPQTREKLKKSMELLDETFITFHHNSTRFSHMSVWSQIYLLGDWLYEDMRQGVKEIRKRLTSTAKE